MISNEHVAAIRDNCDRFISESAGLPVLKNLPSHYDPFKKVKVRHSKARSTINEHVDRAFEQPKLLQRAVFVNGPSSFEPVLDETVCDYNIFYVFVPDAYKFIYNPAIRHSQFDELTVIGESLINDVLTYGYVDTDIHEGINRGAEIIMYNIPYYFCVSAEAVDYNELLSVLR
jgi:hypothetical protein